MIVIKSHESAKHESISLTPGQTFARRHGKISLLFRSRAQVARSGHVHQKNLRLLRNKRRERKSGRGTLRNREREREKGIENEGTAKETHCWSEENERNTGGSKNKY